ASVSTAITSSTSASSTPRSASQLRSSVWVRSFRLSAVRASSYASSGSLLLRLLDGLHGLRLGLALHRLRPLGRALGLLGFRPRLGLADPEPLVDLLLQLAGELRVVAQELLGVVAPLAEAGLAVGEEGPGLLDQVVLKRHVEQAALLGDADAVLGVELGLAGRRRRLVLCPLHPGAGVP